MSHSNQIRFQAEHTLGKLCKWLRILGFDTVFETAGDRRDYREPGRILLTRTRIRHRTTNAERKILIASDHVMEQLRQVFHTLGTELTGLRPFSRCIACNVPVNHIHKSAAIGKVPDYIWENHDRFHVCPCCFKIYWPGSHTQKTLERIKDLYS